MLLPPGATREEVAATSCPITAQSPGTENPGPISNVDTNLLPTFLLVEAVRAAVPFKRLFKWRFKL